MSYGEKLKRLRLTYLMTQEQLAKEMGVGRTTLANWETEKRAPRDPMKKKIAEYFDVSGRSSSLTTDREERRKNVPHMG